MKNNIRILVIAQLLFLLTNYTIAESLTARIYIDDYQWSDSQGIPRDFTELFPNASLTRYYAPLPVFFQGWRSTPRNIIVDYQWDFGDNSPFFHGFNAGHVYETPGEYTVTLTVTDTAGYTHSDTEIIEVLESDGTRYYVDSQLGDDGYDGQSQTFTGENHGPWKTADKVFSEMTSDLYKPGDCILFNRGQIFELSVSEITPLVWPAWGYLIGAYGSGDKPVIQYHGPDNAIIIHHYSIGLAHISFVDLDFRFNDYAGHRAGTFFFAQGGGTRNILFLRVDASDLYSDLFCIGHYREWETGTGTFMVDCSISNTSIDPNSSVTMFSLWASRFVCLNNYFNLSGNHIAYTAIDKGVISGNIFSRPAFGRTALRICSFQEEGDDWNVTYLSNNVQISDNYFHGWVDPETIGDAHNGGGVRYNYLLVQLAPNGPWNQNIRYITFERNIITNGEQMMNIGAAENITVRNNIFISDNSYKGGSFISVVDANKPCKNIHITGNTFVARNAQYSGNINESGAVVRVLNNSTLVSHPYGYTNHEDIYIRNNIFYIDGSNQYSRFLLVNDTSEILPEVHSDHNLFYVTGGDENGEFFQIGEAEDHQAQYLTLAQWQDRTGQDLSSCIADPEFYNLPGSDGLFSAYGFDANLKLMETSPARNNGYVDKQNSRFDFSGARRSDNDFLVDIGAFEYTATVTVNKRSERSFDEIIYPNPTTGMINLITSQNIKIQIYDMSGRMISDAFDQKIDISGFNNGIYFCKLYFPGIKPITKKIVLIKE